MDQVRALLDLGQALGQRERLNQTREVVTLARQLGQ
jgi:hypothetical protein